MQRGKVMHRSVTEGEEGVGTMISEAAQGQRLFFAVNFNARTFDECSRNKEAMPTFSRDDYISRRNHV